MLSLLQDIGESRGLGKILGLGTREAARKSVNGQEDLPFIQKGWNYLPMMQGVLKGWLVAMRHRTEEVATLPV